MKNYVIYLLKIVVLFKTGICIIGHKLLLCLERSRAVIILHRFLNTALDNFYQKLNNEFKE